MTARRFKAWLAPVAALLLAATIPLAAAGCRGLGSQKAEDTGRSAEPVTPVLAVTVAKVRIAPMRNQLRLLGTTAATHHIILRAPVAGRVLGMDLRIGDTVRRGQAVARVLSHEVEAAQQGLEVAKKIDPQDAA